MSLQDTETRRGTGRKRVKSIQNITWSSCSGKEQGSQRHRSHPANCVFLHATESRCHSRFVVFESRQATLVGVSESHGRPGLESRLLQPRRPLFLSKWRRCKCQRQIYGRTRCFLKHASHGELTEFWLSGSRSLRSLAVLPSSWSLRALSLF
jgi:hypothetical protein